MREVPDDSVVDVRVAVDRDVAERDDPWVLVDAGNRHGILFRESTKGFTYDLELALDGGTKHCIRVVVRELLVLLASKRNFFDSSRIQQRPGLLDTFLEVGILDGLSHDQVHVASE